MEVIQERRGWLGSVTVKKRVSSSKPTMVLGRLSRQVCSGVRQAGLEGTSVVVAVSGGPDSLALLHMLAELKSLLNLDLHVAHLDHGLRAASHVEAAYVAEQANTLGLPCTVERVDVAAYRRRNHLTMEQAARQVRYDFLARIAKKEDAAAVALAHTADDQTETLLLHIIRGSGLSGLRGMQLLSRQRIDQGTVSLFRPLLEATRLEVERYCATHQLQPCYDETNLDIHFSRNRIRQDVLPSLRELNPSVREALLRLAHTSGLDMDYVEAGVEAAWPLVVHEIPGARVLKKDTFATLHPALRRHLLRRAYTELRYGSAEGLEQSHIEGMLTLMEGPAGKEMPLPGGVRLEMERRQGFLRTGSVLAVPELTSADEQLLIVPGKTSLAGWHFTVSLIQSSQVSMEIDPCVALLDADVLDGALTVRTCRHGDSFWPLGMSMEKKLQNFLADVHVPRSQRKNVPLVVGTLGVVWVVGLRIAHWARVTQQTQLVVRMEAKAGLNATYNPLDI
jgi:tRNA(Ile)-lysidine synthase